MTAGLLDLEDPAVLGRERLRPSAVAAWRRDVTQPQARRLYERHTTAAGLRWWSAHEASWINVTVFDRAARSVRVRAVRVLAIDDPVVREGADLLGLRVVPS